MSIDGAPDYGANLSIDQIRDISFTSLELLADETARLQGELGRQRAKELPVVERVRRGIRAQLGGAEGNLNAYGDLVSPKEMVRLQKQVRDEIYALPATQLATKALAKIAYNTERDKVSTNKTPTTPNNRLPYIGKKTSLSQVLGLLTDGVITGPVPTPLSQSRSTPTRDRDEVLAHEHRLARLKTSEIFDVLSEAAPYTPEDASLTFNNTHLRGERHRWIAPLLSGAMIPELRSDFMQAIDGASRDETERALESGEVQTDVLLVGGGVNAAVFASELRALAPDIHITVVDSGRLGGQFRSYGDRPSFFINSRTRRSTVEAGLPGGSSNLNRLGRRAVLQLDDFVTTTYPTNLDPGDAAAVNTYLAANQTLTGITIVGRERSKAKLGECFVGYDEAGNEVRIRTQFTVYMGGLGENESQFERNPSILTGFDMYRRFGDSENRRPMAEFNGKNIIIGGCGDTGRTTLEALCRLAPAAAYGASTILKDRGPQRIYHIQDDYSDRSGYSSLVRSRYAPLAPFISDSSFGGRTIIPVRGRVKKVKGKAGSLSVSTDRRDSIPGDVFIDTTGIPQDENRSFVGLSRRDTELLTAPSRRAAIARKVRGRNIFFGGPAAQLPLADRFVPGLDPYGNTVPENSASLWSCEPSDEALAQYIAGQFAQLQITERRQTI